jgi:hypothetical protein
VTVGWSETAATMREDYVAERHHIVPQVVAAMTASGVAPDRGAAGARAQEWYECWLDKAADEIWLLQQPDRAVVELHGLDEVLEAYRRAGGALLLGTHFGAHTLSWVQLDRLGHALTILVHEAMMAVVGNYGLQHVTWMTPGGGFQRAVAEGAPGLWVTYTDVGLDGAPLRLEAGRFVEESPGIRMAAATPLPVFAVDFSASTEVNGRRMRSAFRGVGSEARAAELRSWLDGELAARAQDWMLWRRVPVEGHRGLEVGWHGGR